jgi:hypothetical protein
VAQRRLLLNFRRKQRVIPDIRRIAPTIPAAMEANRMASPLKPFLGLPDSKKITMKNK